MKILAFFFLMGAKHETDPYSRVSMTNTSNVGIVYTVVPSTCSLMESCSTCGI